MDIKTAIIALAAGNCVFGLVLIVFRAGEKQRQGNPYWAAAKLLQSIGWLLLAYNGALSEFFTLTMAYSCLIAGFAYECWAMHRISGNQVTFSVEGYSLLVIVAFCAFLPLMSPALCIAITSLLSTVFFVLSGNALLNIVGKRSPLRIYLGWSFWLMALILGARGIMSFIFPEGVFIFSQNVIETITYSSFYFMTLTGGFGVLLLARESTDHELQNTLQEMEAIFTTLPTGLCIVKDRVIEQCNPAMEQIFGYESGAMKGKTLRSHYVSEADYQKFGDKIYAQIDVKGRFAGEVPYIRKDGDQFPAWVQGKIIFPERSKVWAVFSITDITEQKRQQEQLAYHKDKIEQTSARLKSLEGIIAICMYCKKIRNEKQSWEQLENYLIQNTDAMFSHSLCPECYEKEFGNKAKQSTTPPK